MNDLAARTHFGKDRVEDRARPIVAWLLGEERLRGARSTIFLDRFARRLIDAGLPLDRVSAHIPQLHPQLAGRSLLWDREAGGATEMGYEHSVRDQESYLVSPIKRIYDGGLAIRRRLEGPDKQTDFPILEELLARGFTDYAIHPIRFSDGNLNAFSIATRRPGGFSDLDLAILDEVLPAFSSLLELRQLHRTARELLSTYLGPKTGERVLGGRVRRGDGEVVHAVVWFCDLRGFTAFSNSQPLDEVIALLNDYFDSIAAPVVAHGGEIVKFVGDAMLAMFPCKAEGGNECTAVEAALCAAEAAAAGIGALGGPAAGSRPNACGIAVHIGDVMYGNVGAADRLDFTVIGPAVNLVCRMEKLCAELDHPVVVSAELAKLSSRTFAPLGRHALKGIAEPQEVLTLAPDTEPAHVLK